MSTNPQAALQLLSMIGQLFIDKLIGQLSRQFTEQMLLAAQSVAGAQHKGGWCRMSL